MSQNNSNNLKGKIIGTIVVILVVVGLFNMCSGSDGDGKCDNAGCSKTATCTFGDMELCLTHYISWSDRARKYNN